MVNIYKFFLNFFRLLVNVLFIIQITLIILVFLTATYWFFDLLESDLFSFVAPLAIAITGFVKLFYQRDIVVGGVFVDGSLLLFDIISLILIFVIAKSKYYIYKLQEFFIIKIQNYKKNMEKNFNKQLKKEADTIIKENIYSSLLVEFVVTERNTDKMWGNKSNIDVNVREELVLKSFCEYLRDVKYITHKISKSRILIHLKDFNQIDNVLNTLKLFTQKTAQELYKSKCLLDFYCGVDAYRKDSDFEVDILPKLKNLLNLKQKNEILCFGNFNLRYELKEKPQSYKPHLKGSYSIGGGSDIYALIKKN